MTEAISIFNIGQHASEMNAGMFKQKFESNLFDPKLKDASDSATFIIRAMPWIKDPVNSMVHKNFYALPEPAGGTVIFDSRTTFNRPAENHYEFCELGNLWLKLRASKDPNINSLAGQLRMQTARYCYVQIINYPKDSKLNGSIVPMKVPVDLQKTFEAMAKPSKDDIALGAVPIQPFDITKSKNIKCTVTGKMVNGVLMRDWKIEPIGEVTEAQFPLGKDGAMTPVSKLKQEDVIKYFNEVETTDLQAQFGYHEPNVDTKLRVKAFMQHLVGHIPGLCDIANNAFPEIQSHVALSVTAQQPATEPLPATQATGISQPSSQTTQAPTVTTAGNPMPTIP